MIKELLKKLESASIILRYYPNADEDFLQRVASFLGVQKENIDDALKDKSEEFIKNMLKELGV
jgi:hypothetical protein